MSLVKSIKTVRMLDTQVQVSRWPALTTVLLASIFLSACAVGPDYRAPASIASEAGWAQTVASSAAPVNLAQWWSNLDDPVLKRLVETALAQNLDLRQASARIDEARALRDWVAGRQLPEASVGASVNRRRQSENGPLPIGAMPGVETHQTIYDAGFDATWEIDVFGGKQRALESASAKLEAAQVEAQGVRMRIIAEVARAWFSSVGAAQELATQQATLATLEHTVQLVQQRVAAGDAAAADVDTVYAQLAAAKAELPDIQARQRAAILSLSVLLGQTPEQALALLDAQPVRIALLPIPVGERADILRRRPDILAAERNLAASSADIGVATAELFPKLSIGLSGGFQALSTGNWFAASSRRSSVLPLISWRLFDGGRVRAEIRASEAAEQQAALAYEQAVLAALTDAERALSDYQAGLASLALRKQALEASQRSYAHAQARYAAGDIALVELLTIERALHDSEALNTRAHTTAAIQLVALYKALGGGWSGTVISDVSQEQPVHSLR
ncbi:MAG TPA: efflux transporter outer membrane subunit [Thiopseudomonas sp.]|nr:efflux transporter outer membrane subunit [Thiopseudomonas sp.]